MLDDFLKTHRDTILTRARARVAARQSPKPNDAELKDGIPMFLDQLGAALRLAQAGAGADHHELQQSASRHGRDLLRQGLSLRQVVHDYGDICQTVTELAVQLHTPISADDFRVLNLCLDDAIAAAVTEYAQQHEVEIATIGAERLGVFAHELRGLLNTAMVAFDIIKSGRVAVGGSTSVVLTRSLMGLSDLLDLSLADVRLDAGIRHSDHFTAASLVEEVELGALLHAQSRGLNFTVLPVDGDATIEGDRQILVSAIANLLQNAFKFTRKHGTVSLTTRVTADHVFFDVQDECGGLPPGKAEELFQPFEQRGADRSGVGLGLAICMKVAHSSGGELKVRDLPGKGCVFTLELPRRRQRLLPAFTGERASSATHRYGASTWRSSN